MTATTPATESPPTARDVLRAWYADHPGFHRCRDVTAALWSDGVTFGANDKTALNHKVATFSKRLSDMGDLKRVQLPMANLAKPVTLYGHEPAPTEGETDR